METSINSLHDEKRTEIQLNEKDRNVINSIANQVGETDANILIYSAYLLDCLQQIEKRIKDIPIGPEKREEKMEIKLKKDDKKIINLVEKQSKEKNILIYGVYLLDWLSKAGEINDLINALSIRRDIVRCINKKTFALKSEEGTMNFNQIVRELKLLYNSKIT